MYPDTYDAMSKLLNVRDISFPLAALIVQMQRVFKGVESGNLGEANSPSIVFE